MAKQRSKGAGSNEARANRVGDEELEIAPFTFDSAQAESGSRAGGSNAGLPNMPLGQFGDAEMEFEPFMFDQGQVEQVSRQSVSTATEAAPAGFSFEPFSPAGLSSSRENTAGNDSPIVGGDLPLPSYLSAGQGETHTPADPASWVTGDHVTHRSNETTTSGLRLPTGPIQSLVGTDTGGLGVSRGEQMTGRTPTGPLQGVTSPDAPPSQGATTPVTGLGRARGNTGPLGPLPPDRMATPNASWSDSSLASIEDFSSILIAMQAGKKLRQSGPLSESMIPQSPTATLEAPLQIEESSQQTTDQLRAQMADAMVSTQPQIRPLSKPLSTEDISPFDTSSTVAKAGPESAYATPDSQDIPEWAIQAAQSANVAQDLIQADTPEPIFHSGPIEIEEIASNLAETTTAQAVEGEAVDAPDFSWVTGQWEPNLPGASTAEALVVDEAEGVMADQAVAPEEAPVMVAPTEEPTLEVMTSPTLDAASAELAASREQAAESAPSNLEPEVAEVLKNAHPVIIGGNLTGEELEFEGFMFNEGNATPVSALTGLAGDAHAELPHDMGPVFDPTPYLQAIEEESEEISEYADLDQTILNEMRHSMGMPEPTPEPEESNKTGDLPFWLQGASNEAPTGILIQDIAQRGWGTKEFLNEPSRLMPSEWVGGTSATEPAELSSASMEMTTPEQAQDDDFGQLPPIEPFDFSFLPTNDVEESLGFNTGELIGMAPDDHDPMTVTVNLAAVADLLGGQPESEGDLNAAYEEFIGGDMPTEMAMSSGEPDYEETAIAQAEPQPQQEWDQMSGEADTETVTGLDMDMFSTEPAVSVDMTPMDYAEVTGADEGGFEAEMEAERATLALDAAAEPDYSAEAAEASPEASYLAEIEPPVMVETVEIKHTTPIGEGRSTRGWMASATTNLTDTTLAGMTGELPSMSSPPTEIDLAIDGMEISPFDYDQLELESEEQHTGQLEPDQLQRGPSTGKLAMPEADDVLLQSRPLNDIWSEADGDASLFVTVPADEDAMETAPHTDSQEEPEAEEESQTAVYMAEESEAQAVEMETAVNEYEAMPVETPEPMETAPSAEETWDVTAQEPVHLEVEQPAEEVEIKARVASNRWMAYEKTQGQRTVAESPPLVEPASQEAEMPVLQDGAKYAQPSPAPWEHGAQAVTEAPAMQAETPRRTPRFDESVRMPARGDIMTSGPLPTLERFEDMNEWTHQNPEGLGAQLAMATAYVQSEDFDAALRVYRRIIRKSSTSQTVLRMIGDDLSDLEDVVQDLPRYYQVVGDLLLRLGRHQEAIEAYNKIR